MYIFVAVVEKEKYYTEGFNVTYKIRLEAASGERCLVVPYQEFNLAVVNELKPRAIVMSGFGGHFQEREVAWFLGMNEVMHHAELPMLCICGSHQLLAHAYNRDLSRTERLYDEPIRKLEPGEDYPRQPLRNFMIEDIAEYYVANGFYPIWKAADDPLFAGLPDPMIMRCAHYCEVKQLPPGFTLLASSKHSKFEAIRHASRPLYGVGFHPEFYEAPWLHGRVLLENFARIVNDFWAGSSGRES